MKSILVSIVIVLVTVSFSLAVPASKSLEFTKSSMGKVTFSGKVHAGSGIKCNECHNKETFPKMKFGTVEIKMDKIYAGELCGKCHNGEQAFSAKGNCNRCHKR